MPTWPTLKQTFNARLSNAMTATRPPIAYQRLLVTVAASAMVGALLSLPSEFPTRVVVSRTIAAGLMVMVAFSLSERWPARLPRLLSRWAWQLLAVVLSTPPAAAAAYWLTTGGDAQWTQSADSADRIESTMVLAVVGVFFGGLLALVAMLSEREALARARGLALELVNSELARHEVDARWRLLQAQTTPHFLFNTLATVQALVNSGSPKASALLASLIAYLRAAVPHAGETLSTIAKEVEMARAYLEIMRMRLPDRLSYAVDVMPAAHAVRCPPMMLLTLIENAVRHGIDPSEEGGSIRAQITLTGGRCMISVRNTCPVDRVQGDGLGTGLQSLRDRLRLSYGGSAELEVNAEDDSHFLARVALPVA